MDQKLQITETIPIQHRISLIVSHLDVDFTVEEVDPDEMAFDSDTSVIQPSHFEEASSSVDEYDTDSSDSQSDSGSETDHSSLANDFEGLNCGMAADYFRQEQELLAAREERYSKRHKRWKKGGNKKRRLDHSCGPELGQEDIVPLEDDPPAVGADLTDRRLRRKTEEPTNHRPQIIDLLNRAPRVLEGLGEVMLGDDDEEDPDEVMPPAWMFTVMEVDMDVEASPAPGWEIVKSRRRRRRQVR